MPPSAVTHSSHRDDPLLRSARREAVFALALWSAAITWTITYCYRYGYGVAADELTFVWGFPSWAFWGIVLPWTACTIVATLFSLFVMTDQPLEEPADDIAANVSSAAEADHA
jgi:hypothetical protein